jgi:hypothetical protein
MRRIWQQYPLDVTYEQTALISVIDPETKKFINSTAILKRPIMPEFYQKEFKYGAEELNFEVIENDEKVIYSFDDRGDIRATSPTKEIVWRSRPSFNDALKIFKGQGAFIRFHGNGALEFTYKHGTYYFGPYMYEKPMKNYTALKHTYPYDYDADQYSDEDYPEGEYACETETCACMTNDCPK